MRGGQVRGSAWHVIQRTRRRPVRPAQGTLSPRQGGGVGTGPAAASGAGGGYRRCMEGPGGPVTSAWRVIRATARARVQDSGCLIGRCARRRGRRRGAAGHQLPVIGPVYGHGVRLRVDPWVEESQVDGVRISPYTVSEHGVRHCDRATQTVHFKFGLFPGSFMQLNSSQAKTINRVVERVASTSTPAIERLIFPEAFLAWIDSFPF